MTVESGTERFGVVDGLFCKLDDRVQTEGVTSLSAEERIVYFTWAALGVLGNGSFQYFFESQMDVQAAAQSFQGLGLPDAAECFHLAHSLLPDGFDSADWGRQLIMLKEHEASLDALAQRVLADSKDAEARLADYISTRPRLARLANE
jgi:hypothetical protein